MATYLTRTQTAGDPKKWNFSAWIKRSDLTGDNGFSNIIAVPSGDQGIWINSDGRIDIYGTGSVRLQPKARLRDVSAWYHIVVSYNSTNSTQNDRIIAYLNGARLTDLQENTMPSLNEDSLFNVNGTVLHIGRRASTAVHFYKGYMAQVIFTDGYNYAPSTFGSTNANGIWVPNSSPSVTYGTNGFKLDFAGTGASADASGFGADSSGNGNNLASNSLGTNPSTTDQCINNFATMNPLDQSNSYAVGDATSGTFTLGNLGFSSAGQIGGSERYYRTGSTIALPEGGKWYWEAKPTAGSNGLGFRWTMALMSTSHAYAVDSIKEYTNAQGSWGSYSGDGTVRCNNSTIATYSTIAVNDIVSFKYDADNRDLFIAKNGTYFNSGSAVLTASNITDTGQKLIYLENGSDGNVATQMNFGNPPFAIASGNADANGYGNFEYAVPSGYYALCSKNLAAYGG